MVPQAASVLRVLVVAIAAGALSGCASGARPGAMTAGLDTAHIIDAKSPLYMAMAVNPIEGGKDTNPLWKSNVSNQDFKTALEQSLQLNTMLATTRAKYNIAVTLDGLKQPLIGLDMTVTATVHYVVVANGGGKPIFDQVITSPYTANFSDAFVGMERLRLANEGAIRTNITNFITALSGVKAAGMPAAVSPAA